MLLSTNDVLKGRTTIITLWQFFQEARERHENGSFVFQVAIRFHPSHTQPNTHNFSFRETGRVILTKLNHFWEVSFVCNTSLNFLNPKKWVTVLL